MDEKSDTDNKQKAQIIEPKQYIVWYKTAIVMFLVVILCYASFRLGVLYTCGTGLLYNNKCIEPMVVKTIRVCELKINNDIACANFVLNNQSAMDEIDWSP